MAKISQTSITLELETLSCDEVGNGIVMLDITVEEAIDLFKQLKERFETYTPLSGTTTLEYPPGVRNWINCSASEPVKSDINWELEYSNLYNKVGDMVWRLKAKNDTIFSNTPSVEWDELRKKMPNPTKV